MPGQARVGFGGGSRRPVSSPSSVSPFLLCGLVCAGCRGRGRSARDLRVWVEVPGQQGQGLGEVEEQPLPSPLHGGLAAKDNLQVLAVELPRLGQGHDALPVVGELLDIHFLGDRGRG